MPDPTKCDHNFIEKPTQASLGTCVRCGVAKEDCQEDKEYDVCVVFNSIGFMKIKAASAQEARKHLSAMNDNRGPNMEETDCLETNFRISNIELIS